MKRTALVQLTWPQIEALLAVATAIDVNAESLRTVLPEARTRAAFRGAVTTLQDITGVAKVPSRPAEPTGKATS